jgi:hypothetical protein
MVFSWLEQIKNIVVTTPGVWWWRRSRDFAEGDAEGGFFNSDEEDLQDGHRSHDVEIIR